jgi:hypothetical protein
LYESARSGHPVFLEETEAPPAFSRKQEIRLPPVRKAPMVHARPPSA